MPQERSLLRQSTSEKLLALVAPQVLPTLVPIEGRSTADLFEYDFIAKSACDESLLELLMEHFRRLLNTKPAFSLLTMMPQNAYEFLKQKQPIQAAFAREYPSNLVPLCKVNNFYDIYHEEEFAEVDELRNVIFYELLNVRRQLADGSEVAAVRIRGAAFEDKKALKNFVKEFEQAKKNDPVRLASELELVELAGDEPVWLSRGMVFRELVEALWKSAARRRGYALFSGQEVEGALELLQARCEQQMLPLPYHFATQSCRQSDEVNDGLFRTAFESSFCHFVILNESLLQRELISSLQFMAEMASILNLDAHFVLFQKGTGAQNAVHDALRLALASLGLPYETKRSNHAKVVLEVRDGRSRAWPVSQLYVDTKRGLKLDIELIISLERTLALLLEKNGGYLPLALASEQVRVLTVDKESGEWAREVLRELSAKGVRASLDEREASLQLKMLEASKMKVPYAVVIGRKEAAKRVVSARSLRQESDSEEMSLDSFYLKMEGKRNS